VANPPGYFGVGDHAVVVYSGKIYDPSYGTGTFDDIRAWAVASLDGFAYLTWTTAAGTRTWVIHGKPGLAP